MGLHGRLADKALNQPRCHVKGWVFVSRGAEVVAMPPPGGCARGGGQWAGTHGPPRSVPARHVGEDNGTQ